MYEKAKEVIANYQLASCQTGAKRVLDTFSARNSVTGTNTNRDLIISMPSYDSYTQGENTNNDLFISVSKDLH